MKPDAAEQRAAMRELWPEIRDYCIAHGHDYDRILHGLDGVPVDGWQITARRRQLWLSRQELADRTELSLDAITKIENGRRSPTIAVLARIMRALDADIEWLLRDG